MGILGPLKLGQMGRGGFGEGALLQETGCMLSKHLPQVQTGRDLCLSLTVELWPNSPHANRADRWAPSSPAPSLTNTASSCP